MDRGKINSSAKGFRKRISISDNAKPHLNKINVLKLDIIDFFGTIKQDRINSVFIDLGYDSEISRVLAELCCLNGKLPQGAPTSPALSNIVAYKLDKKLNGLAHNNELTYTRYADDLTFSGSFLKEGILSEINKIVESEGFKLNEKKTVFMSEKSRKIVTGISISSGKMTVPKAKKREIRKKVYFILTRGLEAHQDHIKSKDSSYLKRTLGYLYFWLSIEPDNQYVINSIKSLKKLRK